MPPGLESPQSLGSMRPLAFEAALAEIADVVGESDLSVRQVDRLAYAQDYFWLGQMWLDRGEAPCSPHAVCWPESTEEVSRLLRIATRYRMPVIPYGGGSGTQGGVVPLYGGLVLDLKKLNRVVRVDDRSLTATVEAGLGQMHLEERLNARGLTWAHYPASGAVATVGGSLAARGTGTLSTKYGKAEDQVLALKLVLADGRIIETLPTPSHACGPGLLQLFVGSEGTLGVITEATLRLEPLPAVRRFNGYLFQDLRAALEAGRQIMTRRLRPCTLRLYDPPSARKFMNRVLGLNVEGALLVTGCDGNEESVALEERQIEEICTSLDGKEQGREAGETWWRSRYKFYYPPFTPTLPTLFGTVESTTTFDRIYGLYQAKKQALEGGFRDWGLQYTAHFSHWYSWGVMVYDRFYVERPPSDPREALRLHNRIWAVAARTNLQQGGTLNDHHGIGFKLGWLMPEQYGTAWETLVRIKDALDPLGIMNPGKLGFGPPRG
jgi:alkyldihydroxyacetonephosphate synthase